MATPHNEQSILTWKTCGHRPKVKKKKKPLLGAGRTSLISTLVLALIIFLLIISLALPKKIQLMLPA
jgi:hypothetical protein